MINAVSPDFRAKVQSPWRRAAFVKLDPQIVERFIAHQRETLAMMKSLEGRAPRG